MRCSLLLFVSQTLTFHFNSLFMPLKETKHSNITYENLFDCSLSLLATKPNRKDKKCSQFIFHTICNLDRHKSYTKL